MKVAGGAGNASRHRQSAGAASDLSNVGISDPALRAPAATVERREPAGPCVSPLRRGWRWLKRAVERLEDSLAGDALATRYYWLRAVDTSGNKSAWSSRVQATTPAGAGVDPASLQGVIDATMFAQSIQPIEVVNSLPGAPHTAGRVVFLTSDSKLYRNTGAGWTAATDGADIIANSITGGAIAAGAVNTDQLAAGAVTAEKMVIQDGTGNLLPNGDFRFGDFRGWASVDAGWAIVPRDPNAVNNAERTAPTSFVARVDNDSSQRQSRPFPNPIVCKVGDVFTISADVCGVGNSINFDWRFLFRFLDLDGAQIGSLTGPGPFAVTNTTWKSVYGEMEAPAGAVLLDYVNLRRVAGGGGYGYITNVVLRRKESAAVLILPESITAPLVGANEIITDAANIGEAVIETSHVRELTSDVLRVLSLLRLEDDGAFSAFKSTPDDAADGLAFGRFDDGAGGQRFALSASRVSDGGSPQELSFTSDGFRLLNPSFVVTSAGAPGATINITSTQPATALPAGTQQIRLTQVLGGGGGGATARALNQGARGGDTVVLLYDGNTLMRTITATGAAGASDDSSRPDRRNGHDSVAGTGGAAGVSGDETGKNATGYGAGGGGGFTKNGKGGQGGQAAQPVSTQWIDVSGWAAPKIAVTIGAGGSGGAASGTFAGGGKGSPGRAQYQLKASADTPADVLPLRPTAYGSFNRLNNSAGVFPDLGPGLWIIYSGDGTALKTGTIATAGNQGIVPGASACIAFVSGIANSRVGYSAVASTQQINYRHFSMGRWGQ